jgi:hypothetical protein
MLPIINFIGEAIKNTMAMLNPPGYWANTLASRQPSGNGSRFHETVTEETLLSVEWSEITDQVSAGIPGCRYFKSPLPGKLGVVALNVLPEKCQVTLADPKGTGKISVEIDRASLEGEMADVDFTVLIIGLEEGKDVVFTFHPGMPIRPSSIPAEGLAGKVVSVTEAINLGLQYAKING